MGFASKGKMTVMAWNRDWKHRVSLRWILGGCVLVTFFAARPLLAGDISGTWDLNCRIGEDRQIITLELVQDGSQVSGMGTLRVDDTGNGVRVAVRAGTVHNWDFHFFLVEQGGSGGRPQEFSGSWYEDEMSGITYGAFGSRIFKGGSRRLPN